MGSTTLVEDPPAIAAFRLDEVTSGLAAFLDHFGEGFMALGRDWRILLVNGEADAQAIAEQGWVGEEVWAVLPQLRATAAEPMLRKAMAEHRPMECELPWPTRPGADFRLRLHPIPDGLGVCFRDVTAENALRARERDQAKRLDLLLAATDLGVTYWDLATNEVTLSARAAEMLGVAPRTKLKRDEIELQQSPEDLKQVNALVEAAIASGEILESTFRMRRPLPGDETWIMVRTRAQYDAAGRPTALLGVVVDISKLKAQDARIRESEARFRAFANCAPIPLWVTQPDEMLEFVNQAAAEFSGITQEAFIGREGPQELIHPADRDRVNQLRAAAWARREPYEYVGRLGRIDGGWRWVRAVHHPRFDYDGTFVGYIGACMDITEIQEAETRQRLLVNELNHRVKNTLATVQSIAQQTLRGLDPELAKNNFIDRLLSLSAAHNVLTREHWASADLKDVAAVALAPYAADGRICVRGPSARLAPNVAVGLSMALHELATNAVKHGALSRPDGKVSIAWIIAPDGATARLRWRESGGPQPGALGPPGFGTRLLTRGLAAEFGAPAELHYRQGGLRCAITAPLVGGDFDPSSPLDPQPGTCAPPGGIGGNGDLSRLLRLLDRPGPPQRD